jgi:hypothetical protein
MIDTAGRLRSLAIKRFVLSRLGGKYYAETNLRRATYQTWETRSDLMKRVNQAFQKQLGSLLLPCRAAATVSRDYDPVSPVFRSTPR